AIGLSLLQNLINQVDLGLQYRGCLLSLGQLSREFRFIAFDELTAWIFHRINSNRLCSSLEQCRPRFVFLFSLFVFVKRNVFRPIATHYFGIEEMSQMR